MQQLQSTTVEQSAQTAQTLSIVPLETVMPSEATETNMVQQEQADAVAKLLAALERDTRKRRKWNRRIRIFSLMFLASAICVLIFMCVNGRRLGLWGQSIQLLNLSNWIICAYCKRLLDKNAATELTKLEDVRGIGALIDVWSSEGNFNYPPEVSHKAHITLTSLLPKLQAGDAVLLKEAQRKALRSVLVNSSKSNPIYDTAFTIAILNALTKIGDWKSLSSVQKLTTVENPDICAVALECLPILEVFAEKQKAGETLLRASSAGEAAHVSPETLLRPATPQQETDPDTLLRPSEEN